MHIYIYNSIFIIISLFNIAVFIYIYIYNSIFMIALNLIAKLIK